jgi:multicomponent Na+:H+ antiporter subunit E
VRNPTGAPPRPERTPGESRTALWSVLRTAPVLVVFWLVLSGHFEVLFLAFGTVSVLLVCLLAYRANLTERDGITLPLVLRLPRYLSWLGKEVLVSAFAVVRKVWSPRPALRPVVDSTPSQDLSVLSQVVYANSITFTPGTLSFDVDDDCIKVHSLDESGVEDLRAGAMLRRVRRLEPRR